MARHYTPSPYLEIMNIRPREIVGSDSDLIETIRRVEENRERSMNEATERARERRDAAAATVFNPLLLERVRRRAGINIVDKEDFGNIQEVVSFSRFLEKKYGLGEI